jgi:hypothetical protein
MEGMGAPSNIRSLAKLGWTAALVGLAVLVLAAPASAKGPPNGKGGPPPWAGSGGGSGGGPPARAGKGASAQKGKGAAKKADKALKKATKKREKAGEQAKENPAWTCFGLMIELGDAFAETFGTNENNANAFGKCVSEQARMQREEDGAEPEEEEPAECEEPVEGEEPTEDTAAELASLDENPPDEGEGCEPAEEETGDAPEDGEDSEDGEDGESDPAKEGDAELGLTCFLPAAARANPFAVCVQA